jgi:hypothetical protein
MRVDSEPFLETAHGQAASRADMQVATPSADKLSYKKLMNPKQSKLVSLQVQSPYDHRKQTLQNNAYQMYG